MFVFLLLAYLFNIMFSSSIYFVANYRTSLFLIAEYYSIIYMWSLSIYLSTYHIFLSIHSMMDTLVDPIFWLLWTVLAFDLICSVLRVSARKSAEFTLSHPLHQCFHGSHRKEESTPWTFPYCTLCPSSASSSIFTEMASGIDPIKMMILPIYFLWYL